MVKIVKKSVKALEELKLNHDLVDIRRIRNPNTKKFTWRQKTPFVQRRLNFWLVSDSLQDEIHSTNIILSVKTDHSGISLSFRSIKNQKTGPSYWKFNSSLVDDPDYVNLINIQYPQWSKNLKK